MMADPAQRPMRVALLGSGRGSNARALLERGRAGDLPGVEFCLILSDQENAPILSMGPEFGVDAEWISPGKYRTRLSDESERHYVARLRGAGIDLVVLAGFMRVLKQTFLEAWSHRMINLHPSLLPSFPGLDGIGQAYEYGVKVTGCTVHWVTAELDAGPILDQEAVRVEPGDTLEELSARVHAAEHRLLPRVVAGLGRGFATTGRLPLHLPS